MAPYYFLLELLPAFMTVYLGEIQRHNTAPDTHKVFLQYP